MEVMKRQLTTVFENNKITDFENQFRHLKKQLNELTLEK